VYFHKSHEESRKNAPFSEATQVGNLYFLTGQIGKNHQTGKMVEGGIEAETAQVIKNIEAVLKNHNMTLKEVVKCTVILADIDDFSKMNAVYTTFFVDNLPARTTFAANLVAGAKIEIEVIAAKK
jgi:2-iminobutanoate/2-iminopropanoate deaminase